ncbi:MAG TPA: hypothetical protein VFQ77_22025 [Pseudonocardiaceae bacterium]|jgi:hypothetical protein|nr:hypothetical protein [Pseudonocardiaceae bacterium]
MDTITPLVADAFELLQMDLYRHLDEAELLGHKCQEWVEEDIETARKLIPDLVIVIRGLLLEHQVQPGGACRSCASAWPCPVVTTIHGLIKDPQRQFVALVRRVNADE